MKILGSGDNTVAYAHPHCDDKVLLRTNCKIKHALLDVNRKDLKEAKLPVLTRGVGDYKAYLVSDKYYKSGFVKLHRMLVDIKYAYLDYHNPVMTPSSYIKFFNDKIDDCDDDDTYEMLDCLISQVRIFEALKIDYYLDLDVHSDNIMRDEDGDVIYNDIWVGCKTQTIRNKYKKKY